MSKSSIDKKYSVRMNKIITYLPTLPDYEYSFTCKNCGSHTYTKIPVGNMKGNTTSAFDSIHYFLVCEICLTVHDYVEDKYGYLD